MRPEIARNGLVAAIVITMVTNSSPAQSDKALEGNRYVKVRLALDRDTPGGKMLFGAIFDISEGWHLYWRNPGDSGLPPKVKLKLPAGITAGPPRWPAPKWHLGEGDVLDFIYEKQLVLIWPLEMTKSAQQGTVDIEADIDWLVCREKCVPGRAHVKQSFTMDSAANNAADTMILRKSAAEAPRPLPAEKAPAAFRWDNYTLVIESPHATRLVFFPHENDADIYPLDLSKSGVSKNGSLHLKYPETVKRLEKVSGVLTITRDGKSTPFEITCPIGAAKGKN